MRINRNRKNENEMDVKVKQASQILKNGEEFLRTGKNGEAEKSFHEAEVLLSEAAAEPGSETERNRMMEMSRVIIGRARIAALAALAAEKSNPDQEKEARALFEKGIEILRQISEEEPSVKNRVKLAKAIYALADFTRLKKDYEEALEIYQKGISLLVDLIDEDPRDQKSVEWLLSFIKRGVQITAGLGRFEEAIELCETQLKALKDVRGFCSTKSAIDLAMDDALKKEYSFYQILEDEKAAAEVLTRQIELYKKYTSYSNPEMMHKTAQAFLLRDDVMLDLNQLEQADEDLSRAVMFGKRSGLAEGEGTAVCAYESLYYSAEMQGENELKRKFLLDGLDLAKRQKSPAKRVLISAWEMTVKLACECVMEDEMQKARELFEENVTRARMICQQKPKDEEDEERLSHALNTLREFEKLQDELNEAEDELVPGLLN